MFRKHALFINGGRLTQKNKEEGGCSPPSLAEILDAFMDELNEGKRPTVAEYLAQYPELAEQLEGLLETALLLKISSFDFLLNEPEGKTAFQIETTSSFDFLLDESDEEDFKEVMMTQSTAHNLGVWGVPVSNN